MTNINTTLFMPEYEFYQYDLAEILAFLDNGLVCNSITIESENEFSIMKKVIEAYYQLNNDMFFFSFYSNQKGHEGFNHITSVNKLKYDSKFNKFTITELNTDSWLILKQPFCFSSGIEQLTGDQREIGYTRKLSSFLTFESIKKIQNKI